MKSNKGITLIALVVTIVVLLILAGVSISMLTGENGIIKQAQDAKLQTEIGEEKEAISVAYSGAKIKNEGKEVTASDVQDQFNYNGTKANASGNIKVQFTESKRWYNIDGSGNIEGPFESEDEIETNDVNIVISKTPENEPSELVVLKVEKVEGPSEDVILDDIDINNLSEDEKKDIIMKMLIFVWNNSEETKYKSFNELLEEVYGGNEQLFWQELEEYGLDKLLQEYIILLKDSKIVSIPAYTVINPNNEMSDEYLAMENDVYTFTIVDVVTGETYEQTIEVTNIVDGYYVSSTYPSKIYLLDKETNLDTTFQEAYIIYNEERIDVTSEIENNICIRMYRIAKTLEDIGKLEDANELYGTTQKIELVKDGKSYFGDILMTNDPA